MLDSKKEDIDNVSKWTTFCPSRPKFRRVIKSSFMPPPWSVGLPSGCFTNCQVDHKTGQDGKKNSQDSNKDSQHGHKAIQDGHRESR